MSSLLTLPVPPVSVSPWTMRSSIVWAPRRTRLARIAGTMGMIESSVSSPEKSTSAMTLTAVRVALPVLRSEAVTAVFSVEASRNVTSSSSVGNVYGFVGMATRGICEATTVARWMSVHRSAEANVGTHSSPALPPVEVIALARASRKYSAVSYRWTAAVAGFHDFRPSWRGPARRAFSDAATMTCRPRAERLSPVMPRIFDARYRVEPISASVEPTDVYLSSPP